jgi:radical SAM protein with 4Fe4S-binding SPASM domain
MPEDERRAGDASACGRYEDRLRYAVLELTNRCNLRCAHCASDSGEPRADELSVAEWRAVLADVAALGGEQVTLIGGEPFLHPEWLRIAREVVDLGLRLQFVTNGLPVDDGVLAGLRSLPVDLVGVSLDGATPEGYARVRGADGFDRAWAAVRRLREEAGIDVNVVTTLTTANLHDLDRLHDLVVGAGINWQVQFASSGGRRFRETLLVDPQQHADVCLRLGEWMFAGGRGNLIATTDDFGYFPIDPRHALLHHEWSGCSAGISVVGVRADGDVLGCLSLGDAFVEANLRRRPLREIWTSPASFRDLRRKEDLLRGACRACPMGKRCRGGCTAMAHSGSGSPFENPFCLRRVESDRILAEMGLTPAGDR